MSRSSVFPVEAVRILRDHVRQMTLVQMLFLALWLLVVAIQRICENMLSLYVYLWFLVQRNEEETRNGLIERHRASAAGKPIRASREQAREAVEMHWGDLADNPDDWWDNRASKGNPKAPDFKHRISKCGLWIDNVYTPSWARKKFAIL